MISSLGFFTLWEFKSYILIAFFKPGRGDSVCLRACPKTIHVGTLVFYFYAKKLFETAKEIVKR
ncbi:hypothetical protein B2G51_14695 [Leptospira santarosai]|nr:hypothetical protein B2G51_14695 [Leptospira santarosai]OLY59246.1 hypothetical protein BV917_16880 [Leptospira santarosai serovar Guaricura]ONF85704.1 hypothetical protein BWD13_12675 [Leptospira santarosai serovar Grippotyphosa]